LSADGQLDVPAFEKMLQFLIDGGVHGLFVLGSTSEFAGLSQMDRYLSMETAVRVAAGRVPVIAGILETSTPRVVEQGLHAKKVGVDGVVVAATFYHVLSQAEVLQHFRAVQKAVGLPIVAYDIPSTVKVKLDPRTVVQLASEGTITGLKDSSGAMEQFRQVIMDTRHIPQFRIFTGSETLVDVALMLGAHGVVPGIGNVVPREYVNLYDAAKRGDWAQAMTIQEKLYRFFFQLIGLGPAGSGFSASALGGFKSALKALGVLPSARMAMPMLSFGPDEERKAASVLREFGYLS
jgi:4-hydroxy-tetrahydrodipicolinate synthase